MAGKKRPQTVMMPINSSTHPLWMYQELEILTAEWACIPSRTDKPKGRKGKASEIVENKITTFKGDQSYGKVAETIERQEIRTVCRPLEPVAEVAGWKALTC